MAWGPSNGGLSLKIDIDGPEGIIKRMQDAAPPLLKGRSLGFSTLLGGARPETLQLKSEQAEKIERPAGNRAQRRRAAKRQRRVRST